MAHHKRKRQPNRRAGCKMCKPQKSVTGYKSQVEDQVFHEGFGKLRRLQAAKQDMRDSLGGNDV